MISLRGLRHFIYFLFTYGWLSANIPMPILPSLVTLFETTESSIKLSVTAFLASFAFTQLLWGPLSDKYGRRPILMIGFCITVLGALLASFSFNVEMFIIARFIEAIGMGCGPVIARSIITDRFTGHEVTYTIAISAIIVGIMPSVAPIFGDWLSELFNWQSVFYFLALYGLVLLVFSIFKLPETHTQLNRAITFKEILHSYVLCLRHRTYLGGLLLYGIFYGLQLGYYTAAPFIFVVELHYSIQAYAWFMFFTVLSYILGAYVSKHLALRIELKKIVLRSIAISAIGLCVLMIFYFSSAMSALNVILPMSLVIFGSGMMSPAVNTISMLAFTQNRGAASALLGCSMAGFSALFSASMALFSNQTLLPLIVMLLFVIIAAVIVYPVTLVEKKV